MPKPPASTEDTFATEEETEAVASGLPPLPDATETMPQSPIAGLSAAEYRQQMGQTELKRQRDGGAAGARELGKDMAELVKLYRGGYLSVDRIGWADLPSGELGYIGKIKLKDLDGSEDLADVIFGRWGGGEYKATLFTSRGISTPEDPMSVDIGGDIKPKSTAGHEYLNRRSANGQAPQNDTATQALNLLREKMNEPKKSDDNPLIGQMFQLLIAQATSSKDKDLAEIRAKADRDIAEIKAKSEKEERESKERTERERLASEERVKLAAENAKAMQADAKYREKYAFLREKVGANLDLRLKEMQHAGPLGIDGAKQVRAEVIRASIKDAISAAGITERETEGGLTAALSRAIEESGPDVISNLANALISKWTNAPAAPAAAAPAPALPAPDVDVSPEAPPPAPPIPNGPDGKPDPAAVVAAEGERQKMLAAAATQRVYQFLDAVAGQMNLEVDAAGAWDEAVDENPNHTLEWLYGRMTPAHREAIASAGWMGLRSAVDPVALKGPIDSFDAWFRVEAKADWFRDFLESGPWTEDDETPDET